MQSERSWEIVSEDYNRLCKLCRALNEKMSWLIILSFINNIYFITFQVFGAIDVQTMTTTLEKIYYFISLILLILRIVSVCVFGSWICDESKRALLLITSLPHDVCNKEVKKSK